MLVIVELFVFQTSASVRERRATGTRTSESILEESLTGMVSSELLQAAESNRRKKEAASKRKVDMKAASAQT